MSSRARPASEASDAFYVDETNFVQVIRDLLPPDHLRRMREAIIAWETTSGGAAQPSLNPRADIQGVAADALRVDRRWYDVWRHADLGPLLAACRCYDQMIFPPQIRHVRRSTHFVPWHQDLAYQQSMGARGHAKVMTCFVPLDDEPARHPTIEFALAPRVAPLPHVDAGIFHNAIPDASFAETRVFDLSLGDVLLFGAAIPHRTVSPPNCAPSRYSMEYRLTRRDATIAGKDYFDLGSRSFYLAGR